MKMIYLISILFLGTQVSKAEQLYKVSLKGFPKTARECQASANGVGQAFESATGTKVLQVKCEQTRALSYDLELQYVSEKPINLVESPAWPVFADYKTCLKGAPEEKAAFTSLTGLVPFMEYCSDYSETSGWEKPVHRYTPFFYALGVPKFENKTISLHMYEGASTDAERVTREIIEKGKSVGISIVDAYLDARKSQSDLWLKFEAPSSQSAKKLKDKFLLKGDLESLPFLPMPWEIDVDPTLSETMKACEIQRVRAQSRFNQSFSGPVVWFCMWDTSVFRAKLYHLRIDAGEEAFEKFIPGDDNEPVLNKFATNTECDSHLPAIVDHYKKKLGDRVVNGLCSWQFKSRNHLFSRAFIFALQD